MKRLSSKPPAATVPTKLIKRTLSGILPAKAKFEVRVSKSGLGNLKVVRVITDAWKSEPVTERLERVLTAVRPALSPAQNDVILRFSVLTPKEFAGVRTASPRTRYRAATRSKVS